MGDSFPLSRHDFGSYLEIQAHNLGEIRQLPEFEFVERLMVLYERSITVLPRDPDIRFRQLLVVCHAALMSAGATTGRALPGDAIAVTRRAVEAARLAVAIKSDPANYERWLDEKKRLERWEERNQDRQPKGQAGRGVVYPPIANELGAYLGMLSDVGVHPTPEFISTQRVRMERQEGTPGGLVHLPYFETEQKEVERALMLLASIHLKILEVLDAAVFDGVFHRDPEWIRQREEIARSGRALAERFRSEALGSDSTADGKEGGHGPTP